METFPIYLTLPLLEMSQATNCGFTKNKLSKWQNSFIFRFLKPLPKLTIFSRLRLKCVFTTYNYFFQRKYRINKIFPWIIVAAFFGICTTLSANWKIEAQILQTHPVYSTLKRHWNIRGVFVGWAYSEPCQTFKMELFMKIVNGFQLHDSCFPVNFTKFLKHLLLQNTLLLLLLETLIKKRLRSA